MRGDYKGGETMKKKTDKLLANFRLEGQLGLRVMQEDDADDLSVTFYDLKSDLVYHGNIGKFDKTYEKDELIGWLYAIIDRMTDNMKLDMDEEDIELMESILFKTFWAYPTQILKMIGTGLIEEDYFAKDKQTDPF